MRVKERVKKKSKDAIIQDLKHTLILFIGGGTHFYVGIRGEEVRKRVKENAGSAKVQEIRKFLSEDNKTPMSRMTLFRYLRDLKRQGMVEETGVRGVYKLTENGMEFRNFIRESNRGLGILSRKKEDRQARAAVNFGPLKNGIPQYYAIHAIDYNQDFINLVWREIIKYSKDNGKNGFFFGGDSRETAELGLVLTQSIYLFIRMKNLFMTKDKTALKEAKSHAIALMKIFGIDTVLSIPE